MGKAVKKAKANCQAIDSYPNSCHNQQCHFNAVTNSTAKILSGDIEKALFDDIYLNDCSKDGF